MGYIDKTGGFVIPPKFKEIYSFGNDMYFVDFPDDDEGEYAVDGQFRIVNGPFLWTNPWRFVEDGRYRVSISDGPGGQLFGVLGPDGEYLIQPHFPLLGAPSEGLAPAGVWDGKGKGGQLRGYISEDGGEYVIPIQFEKAGRFSEGLAPVRLNGKWVYIDKTGQVVIEPPYEGIVRLESFRNGLATANAGGTEHPKGFIQGGKWGYLDKTGQWVIAPQFDSAGSFDEHGVAVVWIGDKRGFINRQGDYIWEPTK